MMYDTFGDKMRKRIKKVLISISLAIVCGSICGKIIYSIYDEKLSQEYDGEKVYLIQAGAYSSYDNMIKETSLNNYVYYEDDDGLFKSIIGITGVYDNIDKIVKTYSDDVIISEYYSTDDKLNKKIKDFDKKIKDSSNQEEVKKDVLEMLSNIKDNKSKLIEITS